MGTFAMVKGVRWHENRDRRCGRPPLSQSAPHEAVRLAQAPWGHRGVVGRVHPLRPGIQIQGVHLHPGP